MTTIVAKADSFLAARHKWRLEPDTVGVQANTELVFVQPLFSALSTCIVQRARSLTGVSTPTYGLRNELAGGVEEWVKRWSRSTTCRAWLVLGWVTCHFIIFLVFIQPTRPTQPGYLSGAGRMNTNIGSVVHVGL